MSSAKRKRTWIGITCLALILGSWVLWSNTEYDQSALKAQTPAVVEPKAATPVAPPHDPAQALTDYVNKADDSYKWSVRQRWTSGKSRGLELALQSQTWQGGAWKHQLFLYCPANAQPQTNAICMIDGGSWKDEYTAPIPEGKEPAIPNSLKHFAQAAEILNCPIVVIRQVPHQPLFNNMYEDAIISHTFVQYVKTGEPEWPLLLPMVKSVVRALDSAQLAAKAEWQVDLQKFVLSGASKRGWTTWLTATHDPRIIGIAPMVIDVLNFGPQMAQQLSYYGKFSERIHDYTDKGLPRVMLTAAGKNLLRIVDPFEYREKLKLPKFIILGTNDPYWTVDALNLYFDKLEGEKFILYVPNAGHDLKDFPRLLGAIGGLYQHTSTTTKLPEMTWKYDLSAKPPRLIVSSKIAPKEITLFVAESETRDFRQATFVPKKITATGTETVIELTRPTSGYVAVFAESQFDRQPFPIPLSTTIQILDK